MRLLFLGAALLLSACTSIVWPAPLHELKRPIRPGEWYWCMTPTGETTGFTTQGEDSTYLGATCAAPNRFVQVYVCRDGEMPVEDEYVLRANRRPEVREMLAARVRLSRDNSLVGDRYKGRTFCAPMPPS